MNVLAADILNAYFQAPSLKKHFIICGLEFGFKPQVKRVVIVPELYGGKVAVHDVWMRASACEDGTKYCEYVLMYVDDCLVVYYKSEDIL